MAMMAPTGTSTPTEEASDGTQTKSATMNTSGAMATRQFLETYTTASGPNSAGRMLSNAG